MYDYEFESVYGKLDLYSTGSICCVTLKSIPLLLKNKITVTL